MDRSSLSIDNKNYKFVFTKNDNHTKYAWAIPLKDKSGKGTTTAFKKPIKRQEKNLIKFGQMEVKSFVTKHF